MDEVTLTYYQLGARWSGCQYRTSDKDEADRGASSYQTVTHSYRVGQLVEVAVYFRWQSGTVVELGDDRVRVEYTDKGGDPTVRDFTALTVRPTVQKNADPGDRRHKSRR